MSPIDRKAVRDILADEAKRPRIGLVLGSEGIKSFSALPVIEFLAENAVPVDLVVAVGGGALLAGFWGAGYDLKDIQGLFAKAVDRRFYTDVNYRAVMDIANVPLGKFGSESGLLKPHGLHRVYRKIFFRQRVEDLSPPVVIAATDIQTGRGVMIERGDLAEAVYASGASYPLMPPGDVHGLKLVDGSFSSPLPVMECVKRSMDVIVGVHFDDACNSEPEGFLQCHFNASRVFRKALLSSQIPLAIDMHHYEIVTLNISHGRSLEMWEVERLPEILHGGKMAVQERGDHILEAIQNFSEVNLREREERKPRFKLAETPSPGVQPAHGPFGANLEVVLDDDPVPDTEE